jgi:pimeloyl-ACP methyl ester carboxylesterase
MRSDRLPDHMDVDRRQFLSTAAMTIVGAGLVGIGNPQAGSFGTSGFGEMKQIDAGVLSVGYAEVGPATGSPVILLHGWPYDIHSFVDVAPLLAAQGYRVLVPFLRGYGTTRFLSPETPRNGQQAAVASDCVDFMNSLKIEKAVLAGFDWGARTANIVAIAWPERCKALVSVSGGIGHNLPQEAPQSFADAVVAADRM